MKLVIGVFIGIAITTAASVVLTICLQSIRVQSELADLKTYAAWCKARDCTYLTLADWQALRDADLLHGELR